MVRQARAWTAAQAAARQRAGKPNAVIGERRGTIKTRHDIERLKTDWLRDPCWDIEGTEGFEAHACELHAFRLATEGRWRTAKDAREAALDAEADRLGTHGLLRLVRQLEVMQQRHTDALLHLAKGRNQAAWRVLLGHREP